MESSIVLIAVFGTALVFLVGVVAARGNRAQAKPKPKRQHKTARRPSNKKSTRKTVRKSKDGFRRTFGDDEDLLQTIFETARDKRK